MVIEWLKFHVPSDIQPIFLEEDLAHWTEALAQQPGFISKEIWVNAEQDHELMLIIRWRTREEWKAICPKFLAEIEANFQAAMGEHPYEHIETGEFFIHPLPHIHVKKTA